jgi:hypothetical protein
MPSRLLTFLVCSFFLLPLVAHSQAARAKLSITCDADCSWSVDDTQHGSLKKGEEAHVQLLFGVHNIEATSSAGKTWNQTIELTDPTEKQVVVHFVQSLSSAGTASGTAVSPEKAIQSDESAGGIPTFYAQGRQVLIEAKVWDQAGHNNSTAWVPQGALNRLPTLKDDISRMPPPARGLTADDFHVFDNGTEQHINYFQETDFPGSDYTNQWSVVPDPRGIWGISLAGYPLALAFPSASYLVGYLPAPLGHGECRPIHVVVPNRLVHINRGQYCSMDGSDDFSTPKEKTLATRMQVFLNSKTSGSIKIALHASVFWSSGVLSLERKAPDRSQGQLRPATGFTYVVEVHDSRAPARVQIVASFIPRTKDWTLPCQREGATLYVLGVVYTQHGEITSKFGDSMSCSTIGNLMGTPGWNGPYQIVPTRFETQMELTPANYHLRVVVSDGHNFGRAEIPLRVDALEPRQLAMSDIALSSFVRDASWIPREAAKVSPAPIVPSPLVSNDVQFFPDTNPESRKGSPLWIYFEIYEPQSASTNNAAKFQMRITDKTGTLMMDTAPMSAAKWVVPENEVVPVGLKLDTEKLKKGRYKLDIRVLDASHKPSEWKSAMFSVK